MKLKRHCRKCPTDTQAVCRHAFGAYWCIKSNDGKGCVLPMDDVAKAWYKAGWTPEDDKSIPISLPLGTPEQATLQLAPPPLSDEDY